MTSSCVPDVYVLRNTVYRRSGVCEGSVRMWCWVPWGSWIPPEGAELCAAGSCVGSGSWGRQELCDRAVLWQARVARAMDWPCTAVISETILSCICCMFVLFSVWSGV